jgi:excisionase family DNA binding protein
MNGNKDRVTNNTQGIDHPPGPSFKRLYSIKEAAVYLGRSVWAVRELVYSGKIPIVRDGKRVFIDLKDLDKYIERHRTVYQ